MNSFRNLPFISVNKDSQAIESLWAPARSGDYAQDCATGRAYAAEMIDTGNPTLLTRIVGAMPRGEQIGGVEIGFLTAFAIAASR